MKTEQFKLIALTARDKYLTTLRPYLPNRVTASPDTKKQASQISHQGDRGGGGDYEMATDRNSAEGWG